MPHTALGNVIEICIATRNLKDTITELSTLGITPWKIYTFDTHDNIHDGTINSHSARFRLRVAFAQLTESVAYEVIQPLPLDNAEELYAEGDIFASWLQARDNMSGIHHIAYDCGGRPWEERMKWFESVGAEFVQGGTWIGKKGSCRFAWLRVNGKAGCTQREEVAEASTFWEIILFSDDWEDPEPDELL